MNNFQKMLNKHRDHEAKGIKNVNCDDGVTLNRIPFAYATTLSLIPWFQLVCSPGGGGGFSGSHLTFWSTKAWLSVQNNKISLRFPSVKWGPSVRNQNTVSFNSSSQHIWPHVCLLFHKHRGYACQVGPYNGPRETERGVRTAQSRQQGRAGGVATHTALSEAADVEQTGVTECVPGFTFVYVEVVPAV